MKTVVCFGDSNTYGTNPEGGRHGWGVRWTSLVQIALQDEIRLIEEGLEGRTTVWDDPIERYKNGNEYLIPCLHTHKPIDVIVLMLGTNDTKKRFSVSAMDIANGNGVLIETIRKECMHTQERQPAILLVAPIEIGEAIETIHFGGMFTPESIEKSKQFAVEFAKIAQTYKCDFLNAAAVAVPAKADQLHMDEVSHKTLAEAITNKLKEIL
ncbi:MAG: GDSL-type esterase/lipase family protein [Lachnospiraceae bacterium]